MAESGATTGLEPAWTPPSTLDEARARARERFRDRLQAGEKVGVCGCSDEDAVRGLDDGSPPECVVGVRFRDSGRVYYFQPQSEDLNVGDWVVVPTARGREAARVVIASHQVRRALLQGDLKKIERRLGEDDVARMESSRRRGAEAIRAFGERARGRRLGVKPIAADFNFDGTIVTVSYSIPDRENAPEAAALPALAREMAGQFGCRVELKQVGPRDEARLLGGLGRCGRTLCCSSWLPVFPEISMGMAKNQDLPLNPAKVSGVCGRLLCCLSYENDQYRQMKAVMPKLGQTIETPDGSGQVVSMQLLRELVTVRLDDKHAEVTYRCEELGLGSAPNRVASVGEANGLGETAVAAEIADIEPAVVEPPNQSSRRRRRRRGGRRSGVAGSAGG
jgi:cell fate regulator YaaT (PSP1 superfamily)